MYTYMNRRLGSQSTRFELWLSVTDATMALIDSFTTYREAHDYRVAFEASHAPGTHLIMMEVERKVVA